MASKLLHFWLDSPDVKAATACYQKNPGFPLSDWSDKFFSSRHCSAVYHSYAFIHDDFDGGTLP